MKKINYTFTFGIALILGYVSMNMIWAKDILLDTFNLTGYDLDVNKMLTPLWIMFGLSLVKFIPHKLLNIIADVICILISIASTIILGTYLKDNIYVHSDIGLGAYLCFSIFIGCIFISASAFQYSQKLNLLGFSTPSCNTKFNFVFCTNCGTKLESSQAFCTNCGAKQ